MAAAPSTHLLDDWLNELLVWYPFISSSIRDLSNDISLTSREENIETWVVLARELLQFSDEIRSNWSPIESRVLALRLAYFDVRHQSYHRSKQSPYLPRTIPFRLDPFWPNGRPVAPVLPAFVESSGWESLPFEARSIGREFIDFGEEPWGKGAEHWLLADPDAPGGALNAIRSDSSWPCAVNVFRYRQQFVGFASLQFTRWLIDGSSMAIAVVPWIAINRLFWGVKYPESLQTTFADQVLDELLRIAGQEGVPIGLFVADANLRAKSFYAKHGFQPLGPPRFDRNDGSFRERWVRTTAAERTDLPR
jgi:hypothetical protein